MKYLLPLFLLIFIPSRASHALDASYDGAELILLERMPINISDKGWEQFIYPNTIPLGSIYWNSNNNQYYYVKDGTRLTKTNGLTYKLNPKKAEQTYTGKNLDPFLSYVGYISPRERLYIDKRDNQQYIKVLEPIQDPRVVTPYPSTYDDGGYMYMGYKVGDLVYTRYTDGSLAY